MHSEIAELAINSDDGSSYKIKMPKAEVFRANDIFRTKVYDILKLRSRNSPMVVMDVGANVGLFSVFMKCLDRNCIIHCFEPTPSTFDLLRQNVSGIDGIHINQFGLWNKDEDAKIYANKRNSGENTIKRGNAIMEECSTISGINLKDVFAVVSKPELSIVDVLKIDTEGCEVEILERFGTRLSDIDYIMVEYHSETDRRKIDSILENFSVYGSNAVSPGAGVVRYVSNKLLKKKTEV